MPEAAGEESIAVPQALAGERLDRTVALITERPRSEVGRLIDSGGVSIGGQVTRDRSRRLKAGELLGIAAERLPALEAGVEAAAGADVEFEVVYEDDDVIVVDKPAGLVTHPGAGTVEPTLVAGLLARFPEIGLLPAQGFGSPDRPGIVHRLDKETSGLLVVARSPGGFESLTAQLAARTAKRTYIALVLGSLRSAEGVVDAPIGRSRRDPTRMTVAPEGRQARTFYTVKNRFTKPVEATELELRLETGRTHQIRVHLSAIGHPVVGDSRYGGVRRSAGVRRMMLHAVRLGYIGLDGRPREFEAPLPGDFSDSLATFS
ncbi:MAG TPA: RluA family pseudouridine synthase [Acidimicrobiales bacterium]|jgi:23S rRNA pseudouridine1911/1915/1917 synthase|nr:RluA family pseudouridine synthase [Acidimicrobiales bacterium]